MLQETSIDTATAPVIDTNDHVEAPTEVEVKETPATDVAPAPKALKSTKAPAAASLTTVSMRSNGKRKTVAPVEEEKHDIREYWEKLSEGRLLPSVRQLDEKRVSFYWPNAVLYECVRHGWLKTLDVKPVKTFARTGSDGAPTGWSTEDGDDADVDPMISRQASLARKVAKTGKPTVFEGVTKGTDGIGLSQGAVLPFSHSGKKVDHVLFYMGPVA